MNFKRALLFVPTLLFAAVAVLAAYVLLPPPNSYWITYILILVIGQFVSMVVTIGFGARMGTARFKPAGWIRRIFKIPDDYTPANPIRSIRDFYR
jgi:hypothetical protein